MDVTVRVPGSSPAEYPLLVVNDTPYTARVPLLIGTYILQCWKHDLVDTHGVRFLQKADLPGAVLCGLQAMCLVDRHLEEMQGVLSSITLVNDEVLGLGEVRQLSRYLSLNKLQQWMQQNLWMPVA